MLLVLLACLAPRAAHAQYFTASFWDGETPTGTQAYSGCAGDQIWFDIVGSYCGDGYGDGYGIYVYCSAAIAYEEYVSPWEVVGYFYMPDAADGSVELDANGSCGDEASWSFPNTEQGPYVSVYTQCGAIAPYGVIAPTDICMAQYCCSSPPEPDVTTEPGVTMGYQITTTSYDCSPAFSVTNEISYDIEGLDYDGDLPSSFVLGTTTLDSYFLAISSEPDVCEDITIDEGNVTWTVVPAGCTESSFGFAPGSGWRNGALICDYYINASGVAVYDG